MNEWAIEEKFRIHDEIVYKVTPVINLAVGQNGIASEEEYNRQQLMPKRVSKYSHEYQYNYHWHFPRGQEQIRVPWPAKECTCGGGTKNIEVFYSTGYDIKCRCQGENIHIDRYCIYKI